MPRYRNLNLELRGLILQHAIRQEYLTAQILKLVFRILKDDVKTFSNSGSSISFQNKIDFLYDLDEISQDDYSHFKKLLEIRNQFAHNANCNSFLALMREKKDYTKYLRSKFPNPDTDIENSLLKSYISLFKHCHKLLFKIMLSYRNKFEIEIERYQCYQLLQHRFNEWVAEAKDDLEKTWERNNWSESTSAPDKISFFILTLDTFKHKFFAEILEPGP